MNIVYNLINYLGNLFNLDNEHIVLILKTILILLFTKVLKKIGICILKLKKDNKKQYTLTKGYCNLISFLCIILLFFTYESYVKSLITLISFVSAAVTIALREFIFNFFCGIYINIKKPFKVEDRIEIDDIKGDVVNISTLCFEILELDNKNKNAQSTGRIINIPNTYVFTKPIKNYNKGFKYVWNEVDINVPLDSNLKIIKKEIYKIVNNIDQINQIPKKMKNQMSTLGTNYRIYYNKFDPMIYTKINDDHIVLSIRYLMHPKKSRFVESVIYNKILENNLITICK